MLSATEKTAAASLLEQEIFDDARIELKGACVLVRSALPLSLYAKLLQMMPVDFEQNLDTARILGGVDALGRPEDLAALGEAHRDDAMHRVLAELGPKIADLGPEAVEWLAMGRQGMSSLALFSLLSGVYPSWGKGADVLPALPRDAADFARCRLMLEAIPALAARLPALGARTDDARLVGWCALARLWDSFCAEQDAETPHWRERRGMPRVLNERLSVLNKGAR